MEAFQLLDFSNEIFLEIFRNFNDVDLLTVAQVCKRFKEIANDTVAKKSNGDTKDKYCDIRIYPGAENQDTFCQFLETFGDKIAALKIFPEADKDSYLLKLINRCCRSVKYVEIWGEQTEISVTDTIRGMSNLRSLIIDYITCTDLLWTEYCFPQLERLKLSFVSNVDIKTLTQFLVLNPQLRELQIQCCDNIVLKDIEQMKCQLSKIESLEFNCDNHEITHRISDIIMPDLKSLKIRIDMTSFALLGTIGRKSKNIKKLKIVADDWSLDGDQTLREFRGIIGLFDKLTKLKLVDFDVGNSLIPFLLRSLPNLTTLFIGGVHLRDVTADSVLNTFKIGQNLKEVILERKERYNIRPISIFNSDFHRDFVDIVRDRGSGMKFQLEQQNGNEVDNITVTEEKITKNGELHYWIGSDASYKQSHIRFNDLGEKVLNEICSYLDEQDQCALYETCTNMRYILRKQIESQWFTVTDESTAKDLFRRFEEDITKLEIDMKAKNRLQMTETWKFVCKNYSNHLVEMAINNLRVDATGSVPAEFPNLTKFKIKKVISSHGHMFPLMNCPKLTEIEFDNSHIILRAKSLKFGITLNNLKTIKIDNNVKHIIETFLNRLDDEICEQIEEFTVLREFSDKPNRLVYVLNRFINLTTLNYAYFASEKTYFEQIFKNCTKLKTLTLWVHQDYSLHWRQTLQAIRNNCKQLEVLKLFSGEPEVFDSDGHVHFMQDVVALLPNMKLKIMCHHDSHMNDDYLVGSYIHCQKPF